MTKEMGDLFEAAQTNLEAARSGPHVNPTDELVAHLTTSTDPASVYAVAQLLLRAAGHFPSQGPDEPPVAHGMGSRNIPPTPDSSAGAAVKEPLTTQPSQPPLRPRKI